jgi:hypothetical protein
MTFREHRIIDFRACKEGISIYLEEEENSSSLVHLLKKNGILINGYENSWGTSYSTWH